MHDFLAWLATLPSNPMFAGLTGATVIGGALAMARNLPLRLWRWMMLGISAQLTVRSEDPVFWWIVNWLSESSYGRSARRMRLESRMATAGGAPSLTPEEDEQEYVISPGDGVHWFFSRGALIVISRGKESGGSSGSNMRLKEEVTLRVFTLNARGFIKALIDEARDSLTPEHSITRVYSNVYAHWAQPMECPLRPISSVTLRPGVAEGLLQDASSFLQSRDWYAQRAIPWRRGYLLYGPPGCGKSSIAHALASELGLGIAALSLSDVAGDGVLRELMLYLPRKCILLIEDVDAAFAQREGKEAERISFSGLLNAIDGIGAAEGRILVLTTNHRDRLDPALLRPGRADVQVLIDVADEEQVMRMFTRFFPGRAAPDELARDFAGRSPAEVQGHFLQLAKEK
jgi:chaperone BCS1